MTQAEFAAFVQSRYAAMVQSAYLIVGDRGQAEDVVQAALIKTLSAWDRLAVHAAAEAYTRTTMVRLIKRWARRRWHAEVSTGRVFAVDDGLDRSVDLPSALDVRQALAELTWDHRAVLVLRFFDDLSVEETARILRCSAGTVKSRTSRALDALRQSGLLAEEYSERDHA